MFSHYEAIPNLFDRHAHTAQALFDGADNAGHGAGLAGQARVEPPVLSLKPTVERVGPATHAPIDAIFQRYTTRPQRCGSESCSCGSMVMRTWIFPFYVIL